MSEPANQNTNTQTQEPGSQQNTNTPPAPEIDYEKIASLISGKQTVTEETVLRSYFKEQGLSADEMKQAISAYKDQKAKNTPDVTKLQSDLTTANSALLTAKINQAAQLEAIKQGVDVKSIDYVLKMADFKDVAKDDGTLDSEKITEAISKVLTDIPALKGTAQSEGNPGITKIGGDGNGGNGGQSNTTNNNVPTKRWNKFNN